MTGITTGPDLLVQLLLMGSFIYLFDDLPIERTLRGVRGFMVLTLLGGCARSPSVEANPDAGSAPAITRLEPTSGRAGEDYPIDLTIYGSGFEETGNVVNFGSLRMPGLPSKNDGRHIMPVDPKVRPGTGEVAPFVLLPGGYQVTVTTRHGPSEPLVFRLTRHPDGSSGR